MNKLTRFALTTNHNGNVISQFVSVEKHARSAMFQWEKAPGILEQSWMMIDARSG